MEERLTQTRENGNRLTLLAKHHLANPQIEREKRERSHQKFPFFFYSELRSFICIVDQST